MTKEEQDIVLHASGLSNSDKQYRSHYCTKSDSVLLNKLVTDGYFEGPFVDKMLFADNAFFFLTDAGIELAFKLKEETNESR